MKSNHDPSRGAAALDSACYAQRAFRVHGGLPDTWREPPADCCVALPAHIRDRNRLAPGRTGCTPASDDSSGRRGMTGNRYLPRILCLGRAAPCSLRLRIRYLLARSITQNGRLVCNPVCLRVLSRQTVAPRPAGARLRCRLRAFDRFRALRPFGGQAGARELSRAGRNCRGLAPRSHFYALSDSLGWRRWLEKGEDIVTPKKTLAAALS